MKITENKKPPLICNSMRKDLLRSRDSKKTF